MSGDFPFVPFWHDGYAFRRDITPPLVTRRALALIEGLDLTPGGISCVDYVDYPPPIWRPFGTRVGPNRKGKRKK